MSPRLRRLWLGRTLARSERVVARRIGSELVLVRLAERGADLDSVFNLQGVAPFIWEKLDGTRSGETIVDAIVAAYAVERKRAAADYVELVETLRDLGAAVPAAGARARRVAPVARGARAARARGGRRTFASGRRR